MSAKVPEVGLMSLISSMFVACMNDTLINTTCIYCKSRKRFYMKSNRVKLWFLCLLNVFRYVFLDLF